MKTVCEIDKCNGCYACISICPQKCINIKDGIVSINAVIDESKCIKCNMCKKVCPNITKVLKKKPLLWKQGWASTNIRHDSTSGGAASEIIIKFIEEGGYVASCYFEGGQFKFDLINDKEDAKKFTGSKYVKSNPEEIYEKIKRRLKTNKVLFIGLPCQVAGLRNYIKNEENLYTIDLICHGTPSPILLKRFLMEYGYDISTIKNIKFRTKNDMGLSVNGKKLKPYRVADEYICAFLSAIDYTNNCYSCQYATLERVSDITLGDSWGTDIANEASKGISLMLIQTNKGKELIDKSDLELYEVNLKNAIDNNHQLQHPSVFTNKGKAFMKSIKKGRSFKLSTFLALPKMVLKQKFKCFLSLIGLIKEEI
mgnify:CR=1 FL=1